MTAFHVGVKVLASKDFQRYFVLVIVEGNGEVNGEEMTHENWCSKSMALLVVKCSFILHATSQSECGL